MSPSAGEPPTIGAHAYAGGGGGTVLEHRYGGVLLAHPLTGEPVPMLGDDAVPRAVRFQARAVSPVDDLMVEGRRPDGAARRLSVGVRRAPALTRTEAPSAKLLASYVQALESD